MPRNPGKVRRFLSFVADLQGAVVLIVAALAILGTAGLAAWKAVSQASQPSRALILIAGFLFMLGLGMFLVRFIPGVGTGPRSETNPATIAPAQPITVSGDTMFRDVWSLGDSYHYVNGLRLFRARTISYEEPLRELSLGQIALLRRLAEPTWTSSRAACESVLRFARCADPTDSLDRLIGRLLLHERDPGTYVISNRGRAIAHIFTKLLLHDPRLVAAYRRVTFSIDQGIHLGVGDPIPSGERLPTEWDRWLP